MQCCFLFQYKYKNPCQLDNVYLKKCMTVGRGPFYSLSVKSQTENGIQNNEIVIFLPLIYLVRYIDFE